MNRAYNGVNLASAIADVMLDKRYNCMRYIQRLRSANKADHWAFNAILNDSLMWLVLAFNSSLNLNSETNRNKESLSAHMLCLLNADSASNCSNVTRDWLLLKKYRIWNGKNFKYFQDFISNNISRHVTFREFEI